MTNTIRVCSTPFAVVPEWVMDHPGMTMAAARLYVKLAGWGKAVDGGYTKIFPSQETLAEQMDTSVRTVRRALAVLVEIGVVEVTQRRRGPADYVITTARPEADQDRTDVAGQESKPGQNEVTSPDSFGSQDRTHGVRSYRELDPVPRTSTQNNPLSTAVDAGDPVADEFEQAWQQWPKRGGKRVGKRQALAGWRRLSGPQRHAAARAVPHYAAASEASRRPGAPVTAGAMDMHRWLSKWLWEDWQEPADLEDATTADDPDRLARLRRLVGEEAA